MKTIFIGARIKKEPNYNKLKKLIDEKIPEKNISIEEYDQVWDQLKDAKRKGSDTNWRQFSWQEFIREMEKRGITPEEALKSITDKKRNG